MEFIKPDAAYLDEYLAACKESHDHHITEWMPVKPDDFPRWKEGALRMYARLECGEGLPAGVPCMMTYWCIDSGTFVGEVQIRPFLSAHEAKTMGHIGYAVRYSMWGKGFGTRLLQFALEKLREHQVSPVYVVCHADNVASNIVCWKVGFELAEVRAVKDETENLYVFR